MTLSVKGEGKKSDDRNENYPGHPETTQMHHTLDDTKSSLRRVKGMQILSANVPGMAHIAGFPGF